MMNGKQLPWLMLGLIIFSTSAPASGVNGLTDAEIEKITKKWKCKYCPYGEDEKRWQAEVEAGAGYISNDSFKHGDFTGYDKEGEFLVGEAKINGRGEENAMYFDLLAEDLGLESRRVRMEGGKQGRYKIRFEASQIPKLRWDTAASPYRGGATKTLPAGWVNGATTSDFTTLDAALHEIDILTRRRDFDLTANYIQNDTLDYEVGFRRYTKEGRHLIGASFGFSGSTLISFPVDYLTDEMNLAVNWRMDKLQGRVNYQTSRFSNDNQALRWENAFSSPANVDQGQMALPPDNQWQQLSLSLAYPFTKRTKASGFIAMGTMSQDESYLPFDVGNNGPALPQNSLDGEINTLNANVNLSSRILDTMRLDLRYRHEEQDNQTKRNGYRYIQTDVVPNDLTTIDPRFNMPFGFRRQVATVQTDMDVLETSRLRAGYEHAVYDRTYQERSRTTEGTLFAKWRSPVGETVALDVGAELGKRDGTKYRPIDDLDYVENPLLRKFHLANRDRTKLTAGIDFIPMEKWHVYFYADRAADDYSDSDIGLTESTEQSLNLDVQYQATERLLLTGYLSGINIESKQAGSQSGADPDWFASQEDNINTVGLGMKYSLLENKLDVGIDAVHASSEGEVVLRSGEPFPDLEAVRTTVDLHADYKLEENMTVKANYRYEDYEESDWALDGLAPDTLDNVLTMGRIPPEYTIGLFSLSLRYSF